MRATQRLSIHLVHYDRWDLGLTRVSYPTHPPRSDVLIHIGPYTIVIRW